MHKKRFGQNFLVNKSLCEKIISFENIKNQNILEIGPGNLALSKLIINKNPNRYYAIEIDTTLNLKNTCISNNIIFGDALKLDENKIFKKKNFSIISNLPFNISSQLLIKWLNIQNNYHCINSMTLMFQKELAERIIAKVNTKKYGRLSVLANAFFNIKKKLLVKKNNFFPIPNVDAIVLKFDALKYNKIAKDKFSVLEKITLNFFNERRKKNKKKIKKFFNDDQINKNNLKSLYDKRPENIDHKIFYEMTKII